MLLSPLARVLALEAVSGDRAEDAAPAALCPAPSTAATAAAAAGASLLASASASIFSVDLRHSRRLPAVAFATGASSSMRSKAQRDSGPLQPLTAAQPAQPQPDSAASFSSLLSSALSLQSLRCLLSAASVSSAAASCPVLVSRNASRQPASLRVVPLRCVPQGDGRQEQTQQARARLQAQAVQAGQRGRARGGGAPAAAQQGGAEDGETATAGQGQQAAASRRRSSRSSLSSFPPSSPLPRCPRPELRRAVSAELSSLYSSSDCLLPRCLLSRCSLLSRVQLQPAFAQPQLWLRFSAAELRSLCQLLPAVDQPLPEQDAAAAEAALQLTASLPVFASSVSAYQRLLSSGSLDPQLKGVRMLSSAKRRRQQRDASALQPVASSAAASAVDAYWGDSLSDALAAKGQLQQQRLTFSSPSKPRLLPLTAQDSGQEQHEAADGSGGDSGSDVSEEQRAALREVEQREEEQQQQQQPAPLHARYRRSPLPLAASALPLPVRPLPVLPPPPSSFPHIQRYLLRSPRFRRARHLRLVLRQDRQSAQHAAAERAAADGAQLQPQPPAASVSTAASSFSHLPAALADECRRLLRLCWSEEQKAEAGHRLAAANASAAVRQEVRRQLEEAVRAERRLLQLMEAGDSSGWDKAEQALAAAGEDEQQAAGSSTAAPPRAGARKRGRLQSSLPSDDEAAAGGVKQEQPAQLTEEADAQLSSLHSSMALASCRAFSDFVVLCLNGSCPRQHLLT